MNKRQFEKKNDTSCNLCECYSYHFNCGNTIIGGIFKLFALAIASGLILGFVLFIFYSIISIISLLLLWSFSIQIGFKISVLIFLLEILVLYSTRKRMATIFTDLVFFILTNFVAKEELQLKSFCQCFHSKDKHKNQNEK